MSTVAVSDTFQKAIERFSSKDQSKILKFLFKFLENPASPGLNLESVNHAIDPGMKSARIDRGIRAIVHQAGKAFTLLHVDSHDDAYKWAAKRRIENHPVTVHYNWWRLLSPLSQRYKLWLPSLQRRQRKHRSEFSQVSMTPTYLALEYRKTGFFRSARSRTTINYLLAASRLPGEVGDSLLALASGEIVTPPAPSSPPTNETSKRTTRSSVATSRFWVVESAAELMEILSKPIEDWIRFLHPTQRKLVQAKFAGPSKVSGAAGTGKTVVGLHRAHRLAGEGKRVLMTSYVKTLCQNNARHLAILKSGSVSKDDKGEAEAKVVCNTVHAEALHLAKKIDPRIKPYHPTKLLPSYLDSTRAETQEYQSASWRQSGME